MVLHKIERDLHMIDLALVRINQQKDAVRGKIKELVDHTDVLMKVLKRLLCFFIYILHYFSRELNNQIPSLIYYYMQLVRLLNYSILFAMK